MVRSLAYFNAKFITGYVLTQADYVDLLDTTFNPENKNIYKALLSQVGTADPTVVSLDSSNNPNPFINNYGGAIVWTRQDLGPSGVYFRGTLAGAFPAGKFSGSIIYAGGAVALIRIDDNNVQTATFVGDDVLDHSPAFLETYP